MSRVIDQNPNSPTFGLMIEQGTPTTKAPVVNAPAPLYNVKDRPIEPLKDVANQGGAIMVDDKIYQGKGYDMGLSSYSDQNISQGSDQLRGDMNNMFGDAFNMNVGLLGQQSQFTIDSMKEMLGLNVDPNKAARDQMEIEAAGERERAKWDPLIQEAQRQKEKGFAQATISVGERGGFMNSQMAGVAALAPTVGQDWSGTGGKLNEIESDYDMNISNMKAKQIEAIALAKESARAAIENRDSNAYKQAIELWKLAQDANSQVVQLAQQKVDLVSSYQKLNQARTEYKIADVERIAAVGGDIPDNMKAEVDALYGAGWTEKYLETFKAAQSAEAMENEVEMMKNVTDLLKSYPAGKEIQIGDSMYTTIGSSSDTQTFKEENAAGVVTFVTVDKRTGEVVNVASGGKIGMGRASSGGSSTTGADGLPKEFWTKVDMARNELQQGETWGSVFDRIKAQFPTVDNATIDKAMGGTINPETGEGEGWAKEGAYQEWAAGKKITPTDSDDAEFRAQALELLKGD